MRVRRLPFEGPYTIYAACDNRSACTLLEFLNDLGADRQKDCNRVLALLEKVAQQGSPRNDSISHKISGDIWEFIQGRLRVFYFYEQGKF